MNIETIGKELARRVKTQKDLHNITSQLTKSVLESALNAEMDHHLGYMKYKKAEIRRTNTRNGYSDKTIKCDKGEITIQTPRDRKATFQPRIVSKSRTRFDDFENIILSLYARGMTTRDIQKSINELYYGAEISHSVISNVTNAVMDEVVAWQNRPLQATYPIIFLDCIVVKVRQNNQVINKSIYLSLGLTKEGKKDLLGLWISENEGSQFWLNVLIDLQNRGVKDVFIFSVDGLKGFPDVISKVFPKSKTQLCIVHMVRNSIRCVSSKDKREVLKNLKAIYNASTLSNAKKAFTDFTKKWSHKYPSIERSWRYNWQNLITMFNYPEEIRRIFYTTNAIESLNSVIRKAIRNRKIFPNDKSALKIVYLAIQKASNHWTAPLQNWESAMKQFVVEYKKKIEIQ